MSPASTSPPHDNSGPTPLSQCGPIADLAAKAREAERLSRNIIRLLAEPLCHHVTHAGLRNDRVLLLVESPAWAMRARMEQASILAAVQSLGLAATSVTAKLAPLPAPTGDSATIRPLSPQAAQNLRTAANALADPDLRALFLELADRGEAPSVE